MIKLKYLLLENVQLAEKIYLRTGLLTDEEFNKILKYTQRDYTTKIVTDVFYSLKSNNLQYLLDLNQKFDYIFSQLYTYNKHFFPIENFSFNSVAPSVSYFQLKERQQVLDEIKDWPSSYFRNIKDDVRLPRASFGSLLNNVSYINSFIGYLNNRTDEVKLKILKKIFSSNNNTFKDIINFLEDKENLLYNKTYSKDELYNIVSKYSYDLKIVYDKQNIIIVDVTGVDGIKRIGCNSLWCFTYGSEYGIAGEQWDKYSYNGHVYAIINFSEKEDSSDFINIVTKPLNYYNSDNNTDDDESHIYNMANEVQYGNPTSIVMGITKDKDTLKVFQFEDF